MNSVTTEAPFIRFLNEGVERGGFETDDVLTTILPLFETVAVAHQEGLICGLRELRSLVVGPTGELQLDPSHFVLPTLSLTRIQELAPPRASVEIVGAAGQPAELDDDDRSSLHVVEPHALITRPSFVLGYGSWEQRVGHHDPVTDIFLLGQLLASLTCGLDFTKREDLEAFAESRDNLFRLNARIHPVVAKVIGQMTELDRRRRAQDLAQLVAVLRNYRDQPVEVNLSSLGEYKDAAAHDRRRIIQAHLRDRLFEISRRNRLIYFKPSLQTLNLTLASVPLVMDVRNIRIEQLFVWQPAIAAAITGGQPLSLGKYLRFEDAPYIAGVLDKLIADARRDRAEYGFAQLRLVLCFLNWHNLKEEPEERISSPLLLLPVELSKRKGVRDAYVLQPVSAIAEVNPALRHQLKTLYGISLPETIDLEQTTLDQLYAELERQIKQSEPGVVLAKLDRPKIELMHARARQRLDQWRRKQKARGPRKGSAPADYSYDRENYHPRGLQLFLEKVQPQPFPPADMDGAPPPPRLPGLVASDKEKPEDHPEQTDPETGEVVTPIPPERELYSLRDDDSGNPYRWSFDLCSLTLGNFHYRKMTLVRDYSKLTETDRPNPSFDAVFSMDPRPADGDSPSLPLVEQFPVIPCDAAQAAAVARARTGRSFIIQGPPGTGKSQTITNLIADYVAQGKRVLFVCEKRAAIDVVFHRLRQQGLDELCCLIHDSQDDKRAFILNLKETYEEWLNTEPDVSPERIRERAIAGMTHDLAALEKFSAGMYASPPEAGVPLRRLLARLVEIGASLPSLSPEEEEQVPHYAVWLSHGELVERLEETMNRLSAGTCFAQHPLRWLNRTAIQHPRPAEYVHRALEELEDVLDSLESALELSGLSEDLWDTLPEIGSILEYCGRVESLAKRGQLALIDPGSPLARTLTALGEEIVAAEAALQAARAKTINWKDPLDEADTTAALEVARHSETSLARFVQPAFWRLKKTVHARYDFARHAVEPTLVAVLSDLADEQAAAKRAAELRHRLEREFGAASLADIESILRDARGQGRAAEPTVAEFRRVLLERGKAGEELVQQLNALRPKFAQLDGLIQSIVEDAAGFDFNGLRRLIEELRPALRVLPDFLPVLSELTDAPEKLREALRRLDVDLRTFEGLMARKTLSEAYHRDVGLLRFDGRVLEAYLERVAQHHRDWLKSNAGTLRARVRRRFRQNVQLSNSSAAPLSEEQKVFKKEYSAGRRELEHEFGKTMRYKSIRDLVAGPSGQVIRDLKPIWLMSPLSVSDTLPLEGATFDVVIFDEASQVLLEEAIPAVYRSNQVIVVGDEMQLPPTSFFSTGREGEDTLVGEDAGERFEINLEADSFLSQSARNLPASLLAWHYRSRYETLISFSNAAFYGGNLLTIPDRHLPVSESAELIVPAEGPVEPLTDALLERSISFHFLPGGVYEHRRNTPEANYVALVVRDLLKRETKLSIGIVAFSEAQQGEIENALEALAEDDTDFAARLEAEMNREEDDQFCGLFVKNLENVQGDERDVILLSICYGPDRQKRVLMNFGPINQRGGEKRLNVIFSRARHHLAVVSSIRYGDITNEYNDGANAFKNFLRYSECLSKGDHAGARWVLENLNPETRSALAPMTPRDTIIEQVGVKLRERGHHVDVQVGQSRFRCDLAVRAKDGRGYALGILVDTEAHYQNVNLVDRYLTQPGILRTFGWKVAFVLTKDWLHEPAAVLDRLERLIAGTPTPPALLPDVPLIHGAPGLVPGAPRPAPSVLGRTAAPLIPGSGSVDTNERSAKRLPPTSASSASASDSATAGAPAPTAQPKPSGRASGPVRMFELVEGGSKKFWEVTVNGASFTVRFGRIGTAGQTQEKICGSEAEAKATADELAQSKVRKGYREVQR